MLFETVQSLEDKFYESEDLLNKLYSDNLKSMLYVQKDVSNKPNMIIDDLGTSTWHAFDSEIKYLFIKLVKVDEVKANTTCLKNCDKSCLNNCVKLEVAKPQNACEDKGKTIVIVSCENANIKPAILVIKHSNTRNLPTCPHCEIVGLIRKNCCQRPWNKKDAPKKEKGVEEPSMSKYVPPHRRQSTQRFVPTCHHCGMGTLGHTVLRSVLRSLESRSKSQRQVSLALNLPSLIMLLCQSGNTLKGVLPHTVTMARLATPRPNALSWRLASLSQIRSMKGL
jgi:hypothetical protein